MFIFGEFNTFRPVEAALVLRKAYAALAPGGIMLLEPHLYTAVEAEGKQPSSRYAVPTGLFSEAPHIALMGSFWDPEREIATHRHYIADATTGEVARHAESMQAYT